MANIIVDRKRVNKELLPVLKGSDTNGWYVRDTPFFRRLLEYTLDSKVIYPHSKIYGNLYQFQSDCLKKIIDIGSLLVNLSPGLGKTYVISTLIKLTPINNIVIIAPKALHYIWKQHLNDIANIDPEIRSDIYVSGVLVTNIEQVRKIQWKTIPTFVVIDESITIKNRKSKSFLSIKEIFSKTPFKILLSGSPYSLNISDMWAQLNFLFPSDFTSYWDFTKIFCNVIVDQYGWKVKGNKPEIENMLSYALQDYIYSAHIDDIANLPDYTTYVVNIPPSEEQKLAYKKLKKDFIFIGESTKIEINGPLALLTKLKQLSLAPEVFFGMSESPKMCYVEGLLDAIEKPAIVVSSSNTVLEFLYSKNTEYSIFTADHPDGHKEFTEGKTNVLLMQIKSGKFGHSFTNARSIVYLDYTYNSDDYYQSKARVKRITSTNPVSMYHLHCLPIDEKMYTMNLDRSISVDSLMKAVTESE